MALITYNDKTALNVNPSIADINKVKASDMNEIKSVVNENAASLVPTGSIMQFAGNQAPAGWIICDGSTISRTTYAELFSIIGTTFGSGDGSTTFNIPNLKGKVPVGLDTSDTDFDTLGETGGEKKHTMTVDELVSHTHTQDIKTFSDFGDAGQIPFTNQNVGTLYTNRPVVSNTGNGQPFNVMQPYLVVNYIIKY